MRVLQSSNLRMATHDFALSRDVIESLLRSGKLQEKVEYRKRL